MMKIIIPILISFCFLSTSLKAINSVHSTNYLYEIQSDSTEAIIIPNVFSPNRDGKNDLFTATGNFKTLSIEIFNRWGEVIFKSKQTHEGWNGRTTTGTECPEGTYFYIINTDAETYKGTLTLIR